MPARGAMVTKCPCSLGITICQFSGRSICIGPRSAVTMRWEGRTLCSEAATALDKELGAVVGALAFAGPALVGLKVAPFFLLSAAHPPDFAPFAISSPL